MKKNTSYYPEISLLRGWGILLVVLGHALKQTGEGGRAFEVLLSVIYSFHMPLFFILSGFVSRKVLAIHGTKERAGYIKERAFRLLIPYFVMSVLYLPLKIMLSRYALKPYSITDSWRMLIGDSPDAAVWYIYILFWLCVIGVCLLSENNLSVSLGISFLIALISWWADIRFKLPKYAFFFILGLFLRVHYKEICPYFKRGMYQILAIASFASANVLLINKGWTEVTMVSALSGAFVSFGLAFYLIEHAWDRPWQILGNYSMDIYIFSEPVNTVVKLLGWNILHLHFGLVTALCCILGLLLPIPISKYIIRRVKVFRGAFLGMH